MSKSQLSVCLNSHGGWVGKGLPQIVLNGGLRRQVKLFKQLRAHGNARRRAEVFETRHAVVFRLGSSSASTFFHDGLEVLTAQRTCCGGNVGVRNQEELGGRGASGNSVPFSTFISSNSRLPTISGNNICKGD